MSKQQIIEAIREHNQSADQDFLITFDEEALQTYLTRLTTVAGRRGRKTVWVRPSNSPAVVMRPCAA